MLNPILLSLIGFGVWISYSDLRRGRIKNYMVAALIMTAILVNVFFTKAFIDFPLASITNIFFGIISAVIIWLAGLWSAADAKLFIAINSLLPVALYRGAVSYFPGFSILINFSIPLFFFFFVQAMVKTSREDKKQAFISSLKPMDLLRIIFMVSSIYCLVFIMLHFQLKLEYFLRLVLLVALFWLIEQKFKIKIEYFLGLIFIFALIFVPSFFVFKNLVFISILSLLVILSVYLLSLATPIYSRKVKIEDLSEEMILAEMVVKEGDRYSKRPINFITLFSLLRQRSQQGLVFGYNPDGLEADELERIKLLHRQNQLGFDEIKISKTFNFAPILFLSGLLTYFFKGPFL